MDLVNVEDVEAARRRIAAIAIRTPVLPAWAPRLWLKPENLQSVGAFKIRGAANAVARLSDGVSGVVTHSSGNHGRALGHAAAQRGLSCVVVAPDTAPEVKLAGMRATGAEVVVVPGAERDSAAKRVAAERGLTPIPPFDHHDVIAGQGTIGLEIIEDLPDVDTIVVPIGGGGLASGVAAAVKERSPKTRVVGVEPELAADTAAGFARGEQVSWPSQQRYRTIADGVRVEPSDLTFAHIVKYLDEVVTVDEAEILAAVRDLALRARLVAEPSGALTTAAFARHGRDWGRTVAVISGGNIDPRLLSDILG